MKPFKLLTNTEGSISKLMDAIFHKGKKPEAGGKFKKFIKKSK